MRIVIIGAGIGGLTAALALIKQGFDVEVLEQAKQLGEVGAGLQISPNGNRVLAWLGLEEAVARIASEPAGKKVRLWNTGQTWNLFDLGATSRERYGFPYLTVHRADLHRVLVNRLQSLRPSAIKMGVRIDHIEQHGDQVVIRSAGKDLAVADVVIGADGVHSQVRQSLIGSDEPKFSGIIAWRGIVQASDLPAHMRQPYGYNWVGPGAHVIQYPLRGGELVNFVGAVEQQGWEVESWSTVGSVQACLADFKGWHEDVHTLIGSLQTPYKWALMVRDTLTRWAFGRVALLGDACHPTLPFLAQGAVMALEDGLVLARCLAQWRDQPEVGLQRYEAARIERTSRIVNGSAANAKRFHNPLLGHAEGAAQYVDEQWSEQSVKDRYEWLFEYQADKVDL